MSADDEALPTLGERFVQSQEYRDAVASIQDDKFRLALADQLEAAIRPLLDTDPFQGGYNCCGCSTYDQILDHAIRIVRGE